MGLCCSTDDSKNRSKSVRVEGRGRGPQNMVDEPDFEASDISAPENILDPGFRLYSDSSDDVPVIPDRRKPAKMKIDPAPKPARRWNDNRIPAYKPKNENKLYENSVEKTKKKSFR